MTKYEIIKGLCKRKGYTIARLERDLGFARGSIAKIDAHKPSADRITKICEYLEVDPSIFLKEFNVVDEYEHFLRKPKEKEVFECAAGQGRINSGYEETGVDQDDFSYVRIVGDSMYPSLHDGDVVKVVPATETVPSDFTIVKINGDEATCKHVQIMDNGIWLRGENKDVYKDVFYTVQQCLTLPVQIIGRAISVERKL